MPRPNENYEVENPLIQSILKSIGERIGKSLPPNYGFTLMLFPFDKPELFYISNGKREDILKVMKEFIEKEEKASA